MTGAGGGRQRISRNPEIPDQELSYADIVDALRVNGATALKPTSRCCGGAHGPFYSHHQRRRSPVLLRVRSFPEPRRPQHVMPVGVLRLGRRFKVRIHGYLCGMNAPNSLSDSTSIADDTTSRRSQRKRGIARSGTLFHAVNARGVVTPNWYTRVNINGARIIFPLGSLKSRALQLDLEARARLHTGETIEGVRTWVKIQLRDNGDGEQARRPPAAREIVGDLTRSTLGALLLVHERTYFEALPSTTFRYRISLLNLVETALRHRRGLRPLKRVGRKVSLSDYSEIIALPLTILDDALIADYKSSRLADIARKSPEELSKKRSTNTEIRQARAVFAEEARLAYKNAGIHLPNLSDFLGAPPFRRVPNRPQLPCDSAVEGLFAGLRTLAAGSEADVFTVISLAIYAGLRRGEILHARRSWLQTTAGFSLVVRFDGGFRAKNYSERTIPIPAWLFEKLAKRPSDSWLVSGDETSRRKAIDQAVRWLRQHGFADARKPLHLLRGIFAAYLLATEHSPIRIKSRLGHADLSTTFRFYADEPLGDHLVEIWRQPAA